VTARGAFLPKGVPQRPDPTTLTLVDRTILERLEAAGYQPLLRGWHPVGSDVRWTAATHTGVPVFASTLDRLLVKLAIEARHARGPDLRRHAGVSGPQRAASAEQPMPVPSDASVRSGGRRATGEGGPVTGPPLVLLRPERRPR